MYSPWGFCKSEFFINRLQLCKAFYVCSIWLQVSSLGFQVITPVSAAQCMSGAQTQNISLTCLFTMWDTGGFSIKVFKKTSTKQVPVLAQLLLNSQCSVLHHPWAAAAAAPGSDSWQQEASLSPTISSRLFMKVHVRRLNFLGKQGSPGLKTSEHLHAGVLQVLACYLQDYTPD